MKPSSATTWLVPLMMLLLLSSHGGRGEEINGTTTPYYSHYYNNDTETAVVLSPSCTSEPQQVFVAQTQFLLDGRNDFLDSLERRALQDLFVEIYNMMTINSCDSYFRRLSSLDFVTMSNGWNQTVTFENDNLLSMIDEGVLPPPPPEDVPPVEATMQQQQQQQQDEAPLSAPPAGGGDGAPRPPPNNNNNNGGPPRPPPGPFGRTRHLLRLRRRLPANITTGKTNDDELDDADRVSITYNVTGTCRNCALSTTGSFQLYDDAFRHVLFDFGIRVRHLEITTTRQPPPPPPPPSSSSTTESSPPNDDKPPTPNDEHPPPPQGTNDAATTSDDCTCAAGMEPAQPQAPKISELVTFLNEGLQRVQEQKEGILEGFLVFTDVLQLDEIGDLVLDDDDDENNNITTDFVDESFVNDVAVGKDGETTKSVLTTTTTTASSSEKSSIVQQQQQQQQDEEVVVAAMVSSGATTATHRWHVAFATSAFSSMSALIFMVMLQ